MSPLLCPECRAEIASQPPVCGNGHQHAVVDGVQVLLSREFAGRLGPFLEALRDFRAEQGRRILDESVYETLPHGEAARGDPEWRRRVGDLELLRRELRSRSGCSVLDVGSYNGWLSRHLSRDGHEVTAVDYFSDPHDGLGARRFYDQPKWRSIQLDLLDLSLLNRCYDAVILNRCLQFFPDPVSYLEHAKQRVEPGGILVVTGLDMFRDPRPKAKVFGGLDRQYRQRYGLPFFLRPTRGVLDRHDVRALRDGGLRLRWAPHLRLRNLVSLVFGARPRFYFGTWTRTL